MRVYKTSLPHLTQPLRVAVTAELKNQFLMLNREALVFVLGRPNISTQLPRVPLWPLLDVNSSEPNREQRLIFSCLSQDCDATVWSGS